jgi:hypothetical protein
MPRQCNGGYVNHKTSYKRILIPIEIEVTRRNI